MLYRLVYEYRDELEWSWEERFQPEYGALRDEVLSAFDAYLNCGAFFSTDAPGQSVRSAITLS
ncbi:hypothetical protein EBR25_12970 [bacterium]|nr:hypothetical protein [bacterium]